MKAFANFERFRDKNNLKTIDVQFVQKAEDNEPMPKCTVSYKKNPCKLFDIKKITDYTQENIFRLRANISQPV